MSEYTKLTQPEIAYGQKNLLQGQADALDTIQRLREYKKIREEEFLLKIALKKKLEDIEVNLQFLDKLLPRTSIIKKEDHNEIQQMTIKEEQKKLTLAQEIEEIRRKIANIKQ